VIPLKDENPTRTTPVLTLLLIVVCVGVYFFVQPRATESTIDGSNGVCRSLDFNLKNAAIPDEIVDTDPLSAEEIAEIDPTNECGLAPNPDKRIYLAVLYSMFLHGGLLHLGGNMLYLWIFGNNIEDTIGKVQYAAFYVLAGIAATVAHVALNPSSPIPIVGASGAIAGVMGAYLVLFPNAPIKTLLTLGFFVLFRDIQAKWLLGFWFVSQFFINPNSGVAWAAHVGGFVFGVLAGLIWRAAGKGRRAVRPVYSPY
jgi:membrane associated rhomboid family serine protease